MSSDDRSVIKFLSICGILTNLVLFTISFFGRTISNTLHIIVGSAVIAAGLSLSMVILDPAIPFFSRIYFWTRF